MAHAVKKNASLSGESLGSHAQRYVRVTGVRDKKFVEFDFSIGDPTLFVELMMPFEHYRKFCKRNETKELTTKQCAQVDYDQLKWRNGLPGIDE
ncbi:MAG TPA: phenol hydroxylase [Thiotrichaceae bacterium]|jgi:phenol hydroxylase P0 protein|nr:phenol hydroxylase [Thiotrichaceae bacterium]HIM08053.1 phenol hydroxylase [Gammaproteobacteria bacterium]